MATIEPKIFPEIENIIKRLNPQIISDKRKEVLESLIKFVQLKLSKKKDISLHFICTHNSRRSHLSQIWAQTMANYFNIKNIFCYSGGTESTALYPMVVKTLLKSGFKIKIISENDNSIYSIKYGDNHHPIIGFSKKIDDDFNPKNGFAAIMTCDLANETCPFVTGAEKRFAITFKDPKAFDNTPQSGEKYNERSLHIATEMFFVFSQINL